MKRIERWLRAHVWHKEIGWAEIGEVFTRYKLFECRWFTVLLHQLYAPKLHPECHDHPWGFVTLLLCGGYVEKIGKKEYHRRPGMMLFRPATFLHNVITPFGTSWSLLITTAKSREWGFRPCERQAPDTNLSYRAYIGLYGERNK